MKCLERHPNGEACVLELGHEGNHRLEAKHRCHALCCTAAVPPEMLMCRAHWKMVPKSVQRDVWANYRRGQCDDKSPSAEWCSAADLAITHVALKEGIMLTGKYARIGWGLIDKAKAGLVDDDGDPVPLPLPEGILL